jgi:hypothetical protein
MPYPVAAVRGAQMGGGWYPVFLLRDDFTTPEAAPLTSPRICEPGSGTLTIVDTASQLSIAGGEIVPSAQSANLNDPLIRVSAGYSRVAGRSFYVRIKRVSTFGGSPSSPHLGWSNSSGMAIAAYSGLIFVSGSISVLRYSGTSTATGMISVSDTFYDFTFVLRSIGSLIIRGNTLEWVEAANSTATMYPGVTASAASRMPPGLDTFRVIDLPAPYTDDFGLATQRLAGSQIAGATFVHEANCIIEFTVTTLTVSGTTNLYFRKQDAGNYWRIRISTAGDFALWEVVNGDVGTQRATAPAVVSSGHRIVIIADGTTIRGYTNNVLHWTYSSASNFAIATAGELTSLGTGGVISDIVSWPRTLTGAAANYLDLSVA